MLLFLSLRVAYCLYVSFFIKNPLCLDPRLSLLSLDITHDLNFAVKSIKNIDNLSYICHRKKYGDLFINSLWRNILLVLLLAAVVYSGPWFTLSVKVSWKTLSQFAVIYSAYSLWQKSALVFILFQFQIWAAFLWINSYLST